MKCCVVGGTGFLGLNLLTQLRDSGHEVVATRRPSSNTIFARRLKVPLLPIDLQTGEGLAEAFKGRELVYFCAGHYPRFSVDTETQVKQATHWLGQALRAARAARVRRFVYVGSVSTLGRAPEGHLASEDSGEATPIEGSTYTAIKLALERQALAAGRHREDHDAGLEVVSALPTGLLGPYDHKVGTGYFLLGLLTGKLDFYLDGQVNFIDARDAAAALEQAAYAPLAGKRVILGGHNLRVKAYLEQICTQFGLAMPARALDPEEALAFALAEEARCLTAGSGRPALSREMVDAVQHGQFVDCSLAASTLQLDPRPLEETLEAAATWYRRNGFVPKPGKGDSHERPQASPSEQRL